MKRNNKKGFTIVELVIVIAVIAILSAVLIPTFGGIVSDANETAALQAAKNAYTNYLIDTDADSSDLYIEVTQSSTTYKFTVNDGQIAEYTSETAFAHAKADTGVVYSNATVYTLTPCAAANASSCEYCK